MAFLAAHFEASDCDPLPEISSLGDVVGLVCILEPNSHDHEVAELCEQFRTSFVSRFEREIPPSRMVRQLPAVQALSKALELSARGPLHVFLRSENVNALAQEQAALDLDEGSADAMVIVDGNRYSIWKKDAT